MIELKELISERLKLSKDSQTSKVSQDVYFNEDYDWDRYWSDSDYADGVDDAMDELDW